MFGGETRGGNQGHTGVFFQKRRSPSAEAVRMKSCAPTATKVTTSQCMKLFSYICVFGSSLRAASYSACLCKNGKPWIHRIHIYFAGCACAPGISFAISKVQNISEHFSCTQRERASSYPFHNEYANKDILREQAHGAPASTDTKTHFRLE
jgi:hypothetical protein